MNNNGVHFGLPTPHSSTSASTQNTHFVPNGTFVASAQRAQPQFQATGGQPPLPLQQGPQPVFNPLPYRPPVPQPQPPYRQQYHQNVPNPNVAGPSLNALNSIANEKSGFGIGHGLPAMPAQTWNAGFPPPIPPVPQGSMHQWPMYGQHFPPQNYYGGYPRPHAHGVAPYAAPHHGPQMPAPTVQGQVLPNAAPPPPATQEHLPRTPANVNPVPFLDQEVQQAPPAHWAPPGPFARPAYHQQQAQQAMPQVPSVGPVAGGSTQSSKRKAVDDDNTTQLKSKRCRPQGDPNFAPAQPGPDGKPRWKCLKTACAHVNPMLEISVHKHVTATKSHQEGSSESLRKHICSACGAVFKRSDSLKRHRPSGQCTKNKAKSLESAQASPQVLPNSTFAAGPSSSGTAPSPVAQQSLLLPVATPGIVQAVGNSMFDAAAPVAMPQQQFTFRVQGPAPSSVTQQSSVQATPTEPRSMTQRAPSLPVFSQEVLPEVQASFESTSLEQQLAAELSSQAIQGDLSTPDQTFTPPSSTPELRYVQPSSDNALPVFAGDFLSSMFNQTAAPSSSSPSEDVNDSSFFSAPPSPSPFEDVNDSSLFSAPSSPSPSEDVHDSSDLFSAPSTPTPSDDALFAMYLNSAPPSPLLAEKAMGAPGF